MYSNLKIIIVFTLIEQHIFSSENYDDFEIFSIQS